MNPIRNTAQNTIGYHINKLKSQIKDLKSNPKIVHKEIINIKKQTLLTQKGAHTKR